MVELACAVSFLWREDHGFLVVGIDFRRILECGLDFCDEEHFLIDIWEK